MVQFDPTARTCWDGIDRCAMKLNSIVKTLDTIENSDWASALVLYITSSSVRPSSCWSVTRQAPYPS